MNLQAVTPIARSSHDAGVVASRTSSMMHPAEAAGLWVAHPRAAILAILAGATLACGASALWLDVAVVGFARAEPAAVRNAALLISDLGLSGYMMVGAACVALAAHVLGRGAATPVCSGFNLLRDRAIFVFATVAASGLLVQVLKHVVGRGRPKLMDTVGAFHFDAFSIRASLASFPSGHTTSIFALVVALSLMLPRLKWPLFAVAALVGFARAGSGAHYVSDVIAGAALGSVVSLGLALVAADRGFVFTRVRETLRLKGRGAVGAAVAMALHRRGRTS